MGHKICRSGIQKNRAVNFQTVTRVIEVSATSVKLDRIVIFYVQLKKMSQCYVMMTYADVQIQLFLSS